MRFPCRKKADWLWNLRSHLGATAPAGVVPPRVLIEIRPEPLPRDLVIGPSDAQMSGSRSTAQAAPSRGRSTYEFWSVLGATRPREPARDTRVLARPPRVVEPCIYSRAYAGHQPPATELVTRRRGGTGRKVEDPAAVALQPQSSLGLPPVARRGNEIWLPPDCRVDQACGSKSVRSSRCSS
jgi:hypothetical protein